MDGHRQTNPLLSVEAPEFVLDGVLAAGAVVFAGERAG